MEKTIFITIAEPSVVRSILHTEFWDSIRKETKRVKIIFVINSSFTDFMEAGFVGKNISFEYVNLKKESIYERLVAFFARNAFYTGTNEIMQNRAFLSSESRIPPTIKKIIGVMFGNSKLVKRLIRWFELKLKIDDSVVNIFNKHKPDMVFSTVLLNSFDIHILREAKKRKIKTIGMVRSWDNLTSYGFMRILPDLFFAQNKFLKDMAIKKHLMPASRIKIIGVPLYDLYLNKNIIEPRSNYFKKMGLDEDKKLILYAAIGDFLFPNEGRIAKVLNSLIEDGSITEPTQVVFRAHPAFSSPLDEMVSLKNIIPDKYKITNGKEVKNWDIRHMVNSIYHADIIVTAGSTMMIDGACFGKPIISVSFDGNGGSKKENFWFSIKRFHEQANHIVDLLKTNGVMVVNDKKELSNAINNYINNRSLHSSGRFNIINKFAAPFDGVSGRRLSMYVMSELNNI